MKRKIIISITGIIFIILQVYAGDKLKESVYISKEPVYAKLLLINDEELTLVFDESKGTDKGYDILHADTNFNNNLTDDSGNLNISDLKQTAILNLNFNSKNIPYTLKIYRGGHRTIRNSVKTDEGKQSIGIDAEISDGTEKWKYSEFRIIDINVNFNKVNPIKVFNKNRKLTVKSSVMAGIGGKKLMTINLGAWLDENNSKVKPFIITKNGVRLPPSFTVENETGEVIVKGNLKFG